MVYLFLLNLTALSIGGNLLILPDFYHVRKNWNVLSFLIEISGNWQTAVNKMNPLEQSKEELITQIGRLLQVNAKLQAQLSQTDFRFLVEGIPGIVYLFSTKNGGIFYSSHVADILGFAPSQLISNPMLWHDSIHPEDIPQVNQIIQRVIEDKSFSIEYRIKDSNGKWHWFEDRSLEFKATNDDFLVIGHALDITERKETEKLSNDNQEKYQLLFTTMTEGVALNEIIYDENQEMVDYRIIEVNHAFYSTADYHDIQVIGNVATKLYGISSELIKSFWKTHKELNVTQYAKMVSPLNNKTFLISTSPFKNDKFVTVFFDITSQEAADLKLKESETRWQFALEGAGDGIWDWNAKTNEVFFSKQWKVMLGYDESEIGNSLDEWEKRVHPDDKEKCLQDLEKHFSEKSEFYQNEHRMLCKDGSYKWILDRGKVIDWDNEGKPLRVIGTHSDISNRKNIEKEVIRQNEELAELNVSKDKFFSIIAHDLRGPFSGFLGLTQMMDNDDMPLEQMKQLSKLMHSSAENLFKLLENLLTWASMQKGTIEFNPKKYFLSEILNESIDVLYDFAKQKDIKILNQTSRNLEVTVDSIMLSTIIRNLISNAVKFSNRGGKVIVGAEEKNNQVVIYVQDNGIGMDEKMRNDVFKIDQKTTRKGTEKELSTGLGLLLCKEFVEKHQGKIWVESQVDKGSTFYFTLGLV